MNINNIKVGDKIRIKTKEEFLVSGFDEFKSSHKNGLFEVLNNNACFTINMNEFCNKIFTVISIDKYFRITVNERHYVFFKDWMIGEVVESERKIDITETNSKVSVLIDCENIDYLLFDTKEEMYLHIGKETAKENVIFEDEYFYIIDSKEKYLLIDYYYNLNEVYYFFNTKQEIIDFVRDNKCSFEEKFDIVNLHTKEKLEYEFETINMLIFK